MKTPGVFSLVWFMVIVCMALGILFVAFMFLSTIFWAGAIGVIGGH